MRAVRMLVSPEVLRSALALPEGSEVFHASMVCDGGNLALQIVIERPDFKEVQPGELVPLATPLFKRDADGSVKCIDWGLP